MDVPQARRLERPTWLNARTLAGLVLFAVAFAGGQRLIAQAQSLTPVWAAASDLPAGSELDPADLVVAEIRLGAETLDRYVDAGRPIAGAILSRPVLAGELIPASVVGGSPSGGTRTMTIPVDAGHAVGGDLRPGDRVDVLATFDAAGQSARTVVVARAVEIVEVLEAGGIVTDQPALFGVTVRVAPDDAVRLAFAARTADIDLVRLDGDLDDAGPSRVTVEDVR